MGKDGTILHMFLPQYNDMRPFLEHLTLLALHIHKGINKNEEKFDGLLKSREIYNMPNSEFYNPFNICQVTGSLNFSKRGLCSKSTSQRNPNVSEQKSTNSVTQLATHMTWKHT
jgi:hypothetical protein